MESCPLPSFLSQIENPNKVRAEAKNEITEKITREIIQDLIHGTQTVTAFFDDPDNMYYAFGVFVCGVSIFCFHYWWSNWRQLELECWCCAQKSFICVKFKNKWTCQFCDQFNGFTDDGDIDLVAEAEVRGLDRTVDRQSVFCQPGRTGNQRKTQPHLKPPRLCPHCENNQEYKVRALKNFVPQRESDFDRELEAFERRIEQSCAPCINCQREIDRFLAQQSAQIPQVPQRRHLNRSPRSKSIMDSVITSRRVVEQTSPKLSKLFLSRFSFLIIVTWFLAAASSILSFSTTSFFATGTKTKLRKNII